MSRVKIADVAFVMMQESGVRTVMWGDGILADIAGAAGSKVVHPLNKMKAVLDALELDKRFEPCMIRGHDSRGRARTVRGFTLVAE